MRVSLARAFVVASACALAFAVPVSAQEKPAAAQKEHTMQGCLQKGPTADTFVVQNTAEKGPKMIGILESKANLAPHVGHEIAITGTAVPNKEAASMKDAPKADHYMRISSIKMISASCK